MTENARDGLAYRAVLAENCDRYSDLVRFMRELAMRGEGLSDEERNRLSLAYMCEVNTRKTAIRWLTGIEMKEREAGHREKQAWVVTYRGELVAEMIGLCEEYTELIEKYVIRWAGDVGQTVLWMKIKGDYYRYAGEVAEGGLRDGYARKAENAYKAAGETAKTGLNPRHPQRLAVALNTASYYYEVRNDKETAYEVARKACEEAEDSGLEDGGKDAEFFIQLLKDLVKDGLQGLTV